MATPSTSAPNPYDPIPSPGPSGDSYTPINQAVASSRPSSDPYTPIEEALKDAPAFSYREPGVDLRTLNDSEMRSDGPYKLEQAVDPQAVVWADRGQVEAMTQGIAFPSQDKEVLKLILETYHSEYCRSYQKPALFRIGSKGNLVLTYYDPEKRDCCHSEISMSSDGDIFRFALGKSNEPTEPWPITAGNLFQRLEHFVIDGQSAVKDLHLVQKDPRFRDHAAKFGFGGQRIIIHQGSALTRPPKLEEIINVTQLYPYLNDGCMPLVPISKARGLASAFFVSIPFSGKTPVVFTVGSHPAMICRKPKGEVVAYRIYVDNEVKRFAIENRTVATETTKGGLTNRLIEAISNDPNHPYRHDDPERRNHFEVHQVAFRRFCESQGIPCKPLDPPLDNRD